MQQLKLHDGVCIRLRTACTWQTSLTCTSSYTWFLSLHGSASWEIFWYYFSIPLYHWIGGALAKRRQRIRELEVPIGQTASTKPWDQGHFSDTVHLNMMLPRNFFSRLTWVRKLTYDNRRRAKGDLFVALRSFGEDPSTKQLRSWEQGSDFTSWLLKVLLWLASWSSAELVSWVW
jgi:hypothetical protein